MSRIATSASGSVQISSANYLNAQTLIRVHEEFPDVRCFRANVLAAKTPQGRLVRAGTPGQADITGIVGPFGIRLEIETKTPNDRLSKQQRAWRDMIIRSGGVYLTVNNDVETMIDALRNLIRLMPNGHTENLCQQTYPQQPSRIQGTTSDITSRSGMP